MKVFRIPGKSKPTLHIKNAVCIYNQNTSSISIIFIKNNMLHNSNHCSIIYIYNIDYGFSLFESYYLYGKFYFKNNNTSWKKQAKQIKRKIKLQIFK